MSEEVKQQVKQALDEVASLPADKREALSQIAEILADKLYTPGGAGASPNWPRKETKL